MSSTVDDPIRPWFLAAQSLGEFIGIRYGRFTRSSESPEWEFLAHSEFDGVGGFSQIIQRHGGHVLGVPTLEHGPEISMIPLLASLPRYVRPRKRLEWTAGMSRFHSESRADSPPASVAWHVFDGEVTGRIRMRSRELGATVNTLLLFHLTNAVRPWLARPEVPVPWMVPVNLRGRLPSGRTPANSTSFLSLRINVDATVAQLQHDVRAALESGEHWSNWKAYELCRWLPFAVRAHLLASGLAMPQWNVGAFSNLGVWDPDEVLVERGLTGPWLFCPPVLRCQMLGIGCITFQNRLSVTLQFHPELTCDPEKARALVARWVREIHADLESASDLL